MVKFTLIFKILTDLLSDAMHLSVGEISFIATVFSDQDPLSMPLVVRPIPFILIEVMMIFGINHLAFAFSLSIH
jgi:hypothetical protein